MLNIVALMGRLTADPELRRTPTDISVTTIIIAVDRDYVRQGEERQTDFISVVCWRQAAELVCKYFKKGDMIAVNGRIQTRRYEDNQGNKRTAFEVVADSVHFTGSKRDSNAAPRTDMTPPPAAPSFESGSNDFEILGNDDDMPF